MFGGRCLGVVLATALVLPWDQLGFRYPMLLFATYLLLLVYASLRSSTFFPSMLLPTELALVAMMW